jgi:protein PhnA
MSESPPCPKCQSEHTYQDGNLWICPECSFEWPEGVLLSSEDAVNGDNKNPSQSEDGTVRDAYGVTLQDGDSVIVLKELKIKGSSSAVKAGTKVRGIRLTDGDNGHNIACKIEGIGSLNLKSAFVKKA